MTEAAVPGRGQAMRQSAEGEEVFIDPIEQTGCETQNEAVLLCYAETKDWRKCKKELEEFKKCMKQYESLKTRQ